MSLPYAILSLLDTGPASGYELMKSFDGSVANFWQASHPQIYKELARLEGRGLVSHESVIQQGRPNKKIYSLSAAGRAELIRWLNEPFDGEHINSTTTLKAFAIHLLPPQDAVARLDEMAAAARSRLQHYRKLEKTLAPAAKRGGAMLGGYASLLFGINYSHAYLKWCEQVRELVLKSGKTATTQRRAAPGK